MPTRNNVAQSPPFMCPKGCKTSQDFAKPILAALDGCLAQMSVHQALQVSGLLLCKAIFFDLTIHGASSSGM